jgi:hypothetical protein
VRTDPDSGRPSPVPARTQFAMMTYGVAVVTGASTFKLLSFTIN